MLIKKNPASFKKKKSTQAQLGEEKNALQPGGGIGRSRDGGGGDQRNASGEGVEINLETLDIKRNGWVTAIQGMQPAALFPARSRGGGRGGLPSRDTPQRTQCSRISAPRLHTQVAKHRNPVSIFFSGGGREEPKKRGRRREYLTRSAPRSLRGDGRLSPGSVAWQDEG